ncbi:MAG: hypothetical protein ACREI2_12330 [Nitrospiraceae bacterium]
MFTRFLFWTVCLTYFSLAVWMHIWTLEAGVPWPGEPSTPHHQVCTWIGTSGEAGLASCDISSPKPTVSRCTADHPSIPLLSIIACPLKARAPPSSL